jgi:cathepsin L
MFYCDSESTTHFQRSLEFSNEKERKSAINNLRLENGLAMENNRKFAEGKSNFKQSVYDFSHLPRDEFYGRYTGLKVDESWQTERRKSRDVFEKCDSLPATKNWMDERKVPEVKDQKECSSSYLHSAVSALESAVAIQYDTQPMKLSTQNVLECMKNMTNGEVEGCDRGYAELIWRYSKEHGGLVNENSYNAYTGNSQGECVTDLPREENSEVDYWSMLPADNEEALKCHLAKHGPVVAGISIAGTSLHRYSDGIFDDPENACTVTNPINHAVLIIGYGSELNQQGILTNYWLVQNSWGPTWGQKGYFKMVRGRNLCKIARYVRYPVLKPKLKENPLKEIITPQICDNFEDIHVNNSYQKSYCAVKIPQTYESARITCLKSGMKLFQFNSVDSYRFNFSRIGLKNDSSMFIDGQSALGCNSIDGENVVKPENCGKLAWSFCEYLNIDREFEVRRLYF